MDTSESAGPASDQDSPGTSADPHAEVERALRGLLERALPLGLALGAVATTSSVARSVHAGWQPVYTLHWGLLLAGVALYALRNRVRFQVFVGGLLVVAGIDGVANMFANGLASNGLLVLGCCCVLAGLAFGRRGGLIALGLAVAAWSGIGALITSGTWLPASVQDQLLSPWSWLSTISASTLFVLVVLVATYGVQRRLIAALREDRNRRRELERANAALSNEAKQRRKVERDLAEREERYRLLTENMTDVLFVQDMNLDMVYFSPSAERLFGYTNQEFRQGHMSDWMTPASLERAFQQFQAYVALAMEGDVDIPLMEYEYVRKDGSCFWGELRVTFLRGAGGELTGAQGILRDITARKRAEREKAELEERLRQAEKMQAIGQLAGGVAHDFNNQLTGILMGSELLRRELTDRPSLVRYVDFIRTAASRSSELTVKLLGFARKDQLVCVPTDAHQITAEVIAILERSVDKAISLEARLDAELHVVKTDPAQLESALLNVALNARDALSGGGRIEFISETVRLDGPRRFSAGLEVTEGTYLKLTVRDDGVGMDEATRTRIFEPFYTTKKKTQGTGLGLSTVYGCVESMGGSIDVESEPGEGCSISLYLPVVEEALVPSHAVDGDPSERGSGTILLVDDETVVRESVREMLERLGYCVESCADGESAIRMHREYAGRFDALVLDVVLPKLGGDEVLRVVRERDPSVRVLVVSGYSPEGVAGEMLRSPNTRFLQKPFVAQQLASELAALLR